MLAGLILTPAVQTLLTCILQSKAFCVRDGVPRINIELCDVVDSYSTIFVCCVMSHMNHVLAVKKISAIF